MRQAAGAEVNFKGFNQFRLFERETNTLIAIADMPSGGKGGSSSGGSGSGGSTTPNSAQKTGIVASVLVSVAAALAL